MDDIMVTTGDAECSTDIPDHGSHGRPVAGWRTPASARCVSGNWMNWCHGCTTR